MTFPGKQLDLFDCLPTGEVVLFPLHRRGHVIVEVTDWLLQAVENFGGVTLSDEECCSLADALLARWLDRQRRKLKQQGHTPAEIEGQIFAFADAVYARLDWLASPPAPEFGDSA